MTLEDYVENYSALIVARKEYGMTSYDVVQEISQLFGIKRVGHTGTLDPMAEGVLIIAIGKATKIVELLTAKEKEYIAKVKLGIRTDTRDTEGNIIEEKEVPDNLPIEEVLKSFKKTYLQEVPIYSAVKVKGKKLYEYAREEKEVELPKKEVTIKEIKLLEKNKDTFSFQTLVSKGTYIRSLIDDIGLSLGTFATMTNLIRTKQGKVTLEDASTLDQIRNDQFKIYRIEDVLEYPKIEIEETYLKAIRNGQRLDNIWNIKDKVMFTYKKKLLGIYEVDGTELKVWKNF
ncbi:MAG: tRNA pseudouridine(55) synthase TruB [Bacilli bacterium]|nr:tRNA pseudouridine(55) synthase TruB [Bacilli bacterium]